MLSKLIILLLIVVITEASSVNYTYKKTCFMEDCPSSTTRCHRHVDGIAHHDMHSKIRCLDENGTEVKMSYRWDHHYGVDPVYYDTYIKPTRLRCFGSGACVPDEGTGSGGKSES